jgi:hypothetical protein
MVKQYSVMFDLCAPMRGCADTQGRHLFMEGDLKFKDIIGKVSYCSLLFLLLNNFMAKQRVFFLV